MKATLLREALDESVQDDVCGTKKCFDLPSCSY